MTAERHSESFWRIPLLRNLIDLATERPSTPFMARLRTTDSSKLHRDLEIDVPPPDVRTSTNVHAGKALIVPVSWGGQPLDPAARGPGHAPTHWLWR